MNDPQTKPQAAWNPDTACAEMAELFRQADEIFNQPHYQQEEVSTKSLTEGSDWENFPNRYYQQACCQHQKFEPLRC